MADIPAQQPTKLSWKFPRTFWYANAAELFERAAFYGMFIALTLYLTRKVGFTDIQAGYLAAGFSSIIYLLPTFLGAMADKIGFRRALILAFALLTCGYLLLGAYQLKSTAVVSLMLIMFGGAIVKPVISATIAKCSDDAHRVRAFSIFYQVVNIGAFTGKGLAKPLRTGVDLPYFGHLELGLEYINFYAALMAFCALVCVTIFYRNVDTKGQGKSARESLQGLLTVVRNGRFMALIFIVAGFWIIQGQLYATMPKYLLRLLGESASPEWLANINPLVVVIFVVPVTHMIRHFKAENAIGVGMFIIPLTALCVAMGPLMQRNGTDTISILGLFSLHPITLMVIIGIGMQGFAECFLSPKFLEYASKQAPKGEEGLYLGYQHLTTFVAWALGFGVSGHLLQAYCPDPREFAPDTYHQWQSATDGGYRFSLDAELEADLEPGSLASSPILSAFEDEEIALRKTAAIRRANLDGTNVEDVLPTRTVYPEGIAIGPTIEKDMGEYPWSSWFGKTTIESRRQVLWSDSFNNKIYRIEFKDEIAQDNIAGKELKDLDIDDLGQPRGIAVDSAGEMIYWVDAEAGKIQRARFNGADVENVIPAGLEQPYGLALDIAGGKVYWTELGTNTIRRANLDGSTVETVLASQAYSPRGIALDVTAGKVYWTNGQTSTIQQANTDGSDVRDVITTGLISPNGLTINLDEGKIYWTDFSIADLASGQSGDEWKIVSAAGQYTIKREDGELAVYKDPSKLPTAYQNAHYIWFYFCAIGVVAFFGLLVFKFVTNARDRRTGVRPIRRPAE